MLGFFTKQAAWDKPDSVQAFMVASVIPSVPKGPQAKVKHTFLLTFPSNFRKNKTDLHEWTFLRRNLTGDKFVANKTEMLWNSKKFEVA